MKTLSVFGVYLIVCLLIPVHSLGVYGSTVKKAKTLKDGSKVFAYKRLNLESRECLRLMIILRFFFRPIINTSLNNVIGLST